MIALLAAASIFAAAPRASAAASPSPAPALPPPVVLARYAKTMATLQEPRVFTFEYTLEQTGTRTMDQTHRVFRSGGNERDETLAVNGARSTAPVVRVFRGRPYRYGARALAPAPAAYTFTFAGRSANGKHVDYVFTLAPKGPVRRPLTFTTVTIDGSTFLPRSVGFAVRARHASGTVTFVKADRYWVARTASAEATVPGGVARERLGFTKWRFPDALPPATFATPRPLPPAVPPAG